MTGPRASGVDVSAFSQPVGDQTFNPANTFDPPAPWGPWVPPTTVGIRGLTSQGSPQIPLLGLLIAGALLILFHHLSLRARVSGGAGGEI